MRATDLAHADLGPGRAADEPEDYWQVDLTDAGAAHALVAGCEVVVHTAAIPQPIHNPPHVVFGNNMMSTFNVLEAAIAAGVRRVVNFSSETVPGFIFAYRPFRPEYLPIDEEHPDPAAGSVRDRQVVRRAAVRPSGRAVRRSAALRSARVGSRTRGATSGTSGPSSVTRPW